MGWGWVSKCIAVHGSSTSLYIQHGNNNGRKSKRKRPKPRSLHHYFHFHIPVMLMLQNSALKTKGFSFVPLQITQCEYQTRRGDYTKTFGKLYTRIAWLDQDKANVGGGRFSSIFFLLQCSMLFPAYKHSYLYESIKVWM
jgi:hypothetical protein